MIAEQLPDIRRHPDGRLVICWEPDRQHWRVIENGTFTGSLLGAPAENWRRVLVADLPDPDRHDEDSHGTPVAQWEVTNLDEFPPGTITAWGNGIQSSDGSFYDAEDGRVDKIEADCLKLLAAIHQHRQYQDQAVSGE